MNIDWTLKRQPCPACRRSDKDKTLGVTHDERGYVAHCFRCEFVATENTRSSPKPPPAAPPKRETLSDYGRDLWNACRHIDGVARAYLETRACVVSPEDGDLRWHPALLHPASGKTGPALVALITHAVTRQPMTLHRTWIKADGNKADVEPPRMLLGGHQKKDGVIRLWPDEAVTYGLGIAEGIETALAMAHGIKPVWSCIDAGNLAAFPVLDGVESLTIAADADDAGRQAATRCATRWHEAGREVYIVETETGDLNDLARAP